MMLRGAGHMSGGVHVSAACCCKMGNRDPCRTCLPERGHHVNAAGNAGLKDLYTAQTAASTDSVSVLPLVVCVHSCTNVEHIKTTYIG